MRISHPRAALVVTAALLLAPGCSRSVATSASVNEDGTICFAAEHRLWGSDAPVPGVDGPERWAEHGTLDGRFEQTGDRVGTFTPDGSTPVPVHGSARDDELGVGLSCAIR